MWFFFFFRRNFNYFFNVYVVVVSVVDFDVGNGEFCIKVSLELWKYVDGKVLRIYWVDNKIMLDLVIRNFYMKINDIEIVN